MFLRKLPHVFEIIFKSFTNCRVFDHIIYGYRTSDGKIEDCRENSKKRFDDFLPCTGRKFNHVLFLDDSLHIGMIDDKVEYLQIEPYYYCCLNEISKLNKFLSRESIQDLKRFLTKEKIPKSCSNYENIQIFKAIVLFVSDLK